MVKKCLPVSTIKYYVVHCLCNMFQQCISNIYNVFTNNSQNLLYTDFKAHAFQQVDMIL